MEVTVVERSEVTGAVLNCPKVIINDNCPVCEGKRGVPFGFNFYEDGTSHWCQCWVNPCGHLDRYPNVLKEARSK